MEKILKSKKFLVAAGIAGVILIAVLSFGVGVGVGFRKAMFSARFGEHYRENFMAPPMPMRGPGEFFDDFRGRDMRNAHGVGGKIISISGNNIVIKDRDNKENTVTANDKTTIKFRRDDLKIEDLKNDDEIVVMGKPSESGMIEADLIRVFNRK